MTYSIQARPALDPAALTSAVKPPQTGITQAGQRLHTQCSWVVSPQEQRHRCLARGSGFIDDDRVAQRAPHVGRDPGSGGDGAQNHTG